MLRQDFLSKFSIFAFAYFLTAFSGDTLYSTSLGIVESQEVTLLGTEQVKLGIMQNKLKK